MKTPVRNGRMVTAVDDYKADVLMGHPQSPQGQRRPPVDGRRCDDGGCVSALPGAHGGRDQRAEHGGEGDGRAEQYDLEDYFAHV
jgi:hypothetical protein